MVMWLGVYTCGYRPRNLSYLSTLLSTTCGNALWDWMAEGNIFILLVLLFVSGLMTHCIMLVPWFLISLAHCLFFHFLISFFSLVSLTFQFALCFNLLSLNKKKRQSLLTLRKVEQGGMLSINESWDWA